MQLSFILALALASISLAQTNGPLLGARILSWNVAATADDILDQELTWGAQREEGQLPWSSWRCKVLYHGLCRKYYAVKYLREKTETRMNTILSLQGTDVKHVKEIAKLLGKEWESVGDLRPSTDQGPALPAIYYRPEFARLLGSETFFVDRRPDEDLIYVSQSREDFRKVVVAYFEDLMTGFTFSVVNAELSELRQYHPKEVNHTLYRAETAQQNFQSPNTFLTISLEELAHNAAYNSIQERGWQDLWEKVHGSEVKGRTTSNWQGRDGWREDYIWAGSENPNLGLPHMTSINTLEAKYNGVLLSNHKPVYATMLFAKDGRQVVQSSLAAIDASDEIDAGTS